MQIGPDGCFHLTYCTKVHPGHGWEQLFASLRAVVPALKARLAPEQPFGLGLRLADTESRELLVGDNLAHFQDFLSQNNLYVFTLNGFPFGDLTGPVKSQIFAPDWREESRLVYTLRLVEILQRLLPPGVEGSISTVPLSYKAWVAPDDTAALAAITRNLLSIAARLARMRAADGTLIHLDLEPEPDGLLENSREVAAFFREWLLGGGGPVLAADFGVPVAEARRLITDHLQVCLDTCHLAVAYEDPEEALQTYDEVGIRVGKVQVTAGLKAELAVDAATRADLARQLAPFTGSPYLHQVIAKGRGGALRQFQDLGLALPELPESHDRQWRVHYHMPLFIERHQLLHSTHTETRAVLELLRRRGFCRHLEIETYTWEWLPAGLKEDLLESLHREYLWVLEAMGVSAI
jgi:hypothetical protein